MEAVDIACELIRTSAPGLLTPKGDRDLASEVDFKVEERLRSFLADRTPTFGFVGEENGAEPGRSEQFVWTLDPIDGTVNFVRGIPLCAVSLALVAEDRPVLGVIGLPFLGGRYTAAAGAGARLDGRPTEVRHSARLQDSIVALGDFAVVKDADRRNILQLEVATRVASRALRVRMLGTAAIDLAWLAEGRIDASITLSNNPWDMAAGVVIAQEAGARVVDLDGSDYRMSSHGVLAASPSVIDQLVAIVREAKQQTGQGG